MARGILWFLVDLNPTGGTRPFPEYVNDRGILLQLPALRVPFSETIQAACQQKEGARQFKLPVACQWRGLLSRKRGRLLALGDSPR